MNITDIVLKLFINKYYKKSKKEMLRDKRKNILKEKQNPDYFNI
ncbi:hypothetical protein MmTuc01_1622 [Methanosarcina mazei Tuc01]|uniref:Uncharacterized protein n=1 Tax=Methanosarcina mazei Tuc01 TaxID=1236903 RepID=M1Q9X6_METMZ|nr:hypothetical protein MmTuc01_1622 [Methanosarcina mazei Tuc01]